MIFAVWADRKGIDDADLVAAREQFVSKGQACLGASDLGKRHGWGVHSGAQGRVGLYGIGTPEHEAFAQGVSPLDGSPVKVKQAMKSSR